MCTTIKCYTEVTRGIPIHAQLPFFVPEKTT